MKRVSTVTFSVVGLLAGILFALPLSAQDKAKPKPATSSDSPGTVITKNQADRILDELHQVRQMLEKQQAQLDRLAAPQPSAPTPPEKVRVSVESTWHSLGRADAPITLVEFADYECPFCKAFHTGTYGELKKNYIDTGKVRFVSRDLPLDFHPTAMRAAEAARCAGDEGKFWELRDALLANPSAPNDDVIKKAAENLSIEMKGLQACLDSNKYKAEVQEDAAEAVKLELNGTPSFILGRTAGDKLDGVVLVGAQPYASFEAAIQKILIGNTAIQTSVSPQPTVSVTPPQPMGNAQAVIISGSGVNESEGKSNEKRKAGSETSPVGSVQQRDAGHPKIETLQPVPSGKLKHPPSKTGISPLPPSTDATSEVQAKSHDLGPKPENQRAVTFIENGGQWDERVKFQLKSGGKTLWLTNSGVVFDNIRAKASESSGASDDLKSVVRSPLPPPLDKYERLVFSEDFANANSAPSIEAIGVQPGKHNYLVGSDPAKWHTGVLSYAAVIYHNVWEGIDVKVAKNGADIEQEFVVHPGADLNRVQVAYRGIERLETASDGSLLVRTVYGDLTESAPRIYQDIAGKRVPVPGRFKLTSETAYTFEVKAGDPQYALVIDPTLLYSTFLGGSSGGSCNPVGGCGPTELGRSIAVDASGSAYVTGETGSPDFPLTTGVFQTTGVGVFVTKLSPLGDKLAYSTFLGANNGLLSGYGIAVDKSGEAYVTGVAGIGHPTTPNAFQQTCSQGNGFLTKLSAAGDSLIYSTCLGGGSTPLGIAVDASSRAYIAGFTGAGLPTTPGAFLQSIPSSSAQIGFLSVLDPSASGAASLVYSTYIGGSVSDTAYSVAVDSFGMAYVAGLAASPDFPVTAGAYQTNMNNPTSGGYDGFIAKLNPNVSGSASLIYATFLGGTGYSSAQGIAVDALGNAYITGRTQNTNFPITAGPFPNLLSGSGFITRLNAAGNKLVYSSVLGGGIGTAITADPLGNAYLAGYLDCRNSTIQTTPDAFQPNCPSTSGSSAFVMKVDPTGALAYSSYLGGVPLNYIGDAALGIAVDAIGDAYVTGYTSSPTFPVTPAAYQHALDPGGVAFPVDAFVTKFPLGSSQTLSVSALTPSAGGNSGTVSPQIFGTAFHAGATAKLNCAGQAAIVGTNLTVGPGGRFLNATFNLAGALSGACDIVVTNPDGTSATLPQGFTVQQGGTPSIQFYLTGVEERKVPAEVAVGPAEAIVFATVSNTGNVDSGAFLVSEPVAPPFSLTSVNPPGVASLATLTADSQVVWSGPVAAGSSQVFALTAGTPSSSPNGLVAGTITTPDQIAYALCLDDNANSLAAFCPAFIDVVRLDCQNAYVECATGIQSEPCANLIRECQTDMAHCNAKGALAVAALCGLQTVSPVALVEPADPNGIVGPPGVGTQRWTPGAQRLTYAISFNNEPTATAPAQQVTVTEPLGADVNLSTLSLPIITLPNVGSEVQVPVLPPSFNPAAGVNEYKTNVDLRPTQKLLVAIDALVNPNTETLTWTFTSIDPATGLPPLNPLVGFLPPGAGATISFSATPRTGLATGSQVTEQATIVFDGQTPMSTRAWLNTIDNTSPTSHVTGLPSNETSTNFTVAWTGTDVGSGIQDYTIYTSDNGGPFTVWQQNTTSTSATITGQLGHTYGFYSIARDLVGNVEPAKTVAETTTTVTVPPPDYALSTTTSTLTLAAGQMGSATITVTPQGYSGAVNFNCGTLPSYITCTFSPSNSVTVSGTAPSTIQVGVQIAATVSKLGQGRIVLFAAALPLGLFGFLPVFGGKRKRRLRYLAVLLLICGASGVMLGCNSTSSSNTGPKLPPAGTQTITLSSSGSGGISHQLSLQVIVTN
jgi:protein-disulfide isomerase